ncbi:hypothetical protein HMPREF3198_01710 [Winkia neuii]|nr:hypothetical protein HMPREF3198_01710 [Winkia neuii]
MHMHRNIFAQHFCQFFNMHTGATVNVRGIFTGQQVYAHDELLTASLYVNTITLSNSKLQRGQFSAR